VAVTDEQRTMLQLLLEGGQSYDDIGGLLGISGDDVRERAREALREMGGADPDAQASLTDYLLGKADPIGRADAVRQLQNDPASNELASRLVAQLRLLAPRASLPEIPTARGGRRAAAPPPPPTAGPVATGPAPGEQPAAKPSGESLPARLAGRLGGLTGRLRERRPDSVRNQRLMFGLGAAGLLVIAVVAALVVFGGDDSGGDGTETTATTTTANEDVTVVNLEPVEGSEATGQAAFGAVGNQPALRINIAGLEPTTKTENYIVWLYNSSKVAFPLARQQVGDDGNLRGDAPVPNALVSLLPQFGCVDVSLASNKQTSQALKAAAKGQNLPRHTGSSILRGMIPRPGLEVTNGADSDCTAAAEAAAASSGETTTTP
jgi:hypothetical protein